MIRAHAKNGITLFNCTSCKAEIHISMYAIAQMAMGHDMLHTCECGQRHGITQAYDRNGYVIAPEPIITSTKGAPA